MKLNLVCESPQREGEFKELIQRWGLEQQADAPFALHLSAERLELYKQDEPKLGAIYVDFVGGAAGHRRRFGGGKGQSIAKAVGMNKGRVPHVLDGTAGLGRDAFVLASLGCRVTMFERHPVVAALLEDGLQRAKQDMDIGEWVSERMQLAYTSSIDGLAGYQGELPEVVYLDPMFPHKKKSALVKKEMRVFQSLVGADMDADALLAPALQLAQKRVVVKRPDYAPPLANKTPSTSIKTKKNRFDVYVVPNRGVE